MSMREYKNQIKSSTRTEFTIEMSKWDNTTASKQWISSNMPSTPLKTRLLCIMISVISSTTRIIHLSNKSFIGKCIKIKIYLQTKMGTRNSSISKILSLQLLRIISIISSISKETCILINNRIKTPNFNININSRTHRDTKWIKWINSRISIITIKDTNKVMRTQMGFNIRLTIKTGANININNKTWLLRLILSIMTDKIKFHSSKGNNRNTTNICFSSRINISKTTLINIKKNIDLYILIYKRYFNLCFDFSEKFSFLGTGLLLKWLNWLDIRESLIRIELIDVYYKSKIKSCWILYGEGVVSVSSIFF